MSFPSLIPESVLITTVTVKIDVEPVFTRRIPLLFLNVLKCPETASNVVENSVQHDFDMMLMQIVTDILKIFIGSKAAVHLFKVSGIITVIVRFENRI